MAPEVREEIKAALALALRRSAAYVAGLAIPVTATHLAVAYRQATGMVKITGLDTTLSLILAGSALTVFLLLAGLFRGRGWALLCLLPGALFPIFNAISRLGWFGGIAVLAAGAAAYAVVMEPRHMGTLAELWRRRFPPSGKRTGG